MKASQIVSVALIVAGLAVAGFWFFSHRGSSVPMKAASDRGQVLYWYDAMKPDVHFDKPGKSPFMDMQLQPKYASEESGGSMMISIDPRMVQNLGIRTSTVERGTVGGEIRTTGVVAVNEESVQVVQTRAAGWVERLHVRAVGERVKQGELLAEVYSPDILSAAQDLVVAGHATSDASNQPLVEAARHRLSLLGLADPEIARIEKSGRAERRVGLFAPLSGVVTDLGVREGGQVNPGMNLFAIADLSKVWLIAQIPEGQGGSALQGQSAEARVVALPAHTFRGRVDYVYPELVSETRTLKARIVFENPRIELKPGMYADVILQSAAGPSALQMPSEALIRTGTRTTVVVADGGGRFHPVEVVAGEESNGKVAIFKGLNAGDQVVTSGQFLIDSEANLRGAFSHMAAPQGVPGEERQP